MIRIFDIEDGVLKINENCVLIPELKKIMDEYKEDAIPALSYVYFMTSPDSPYGNIPEEEKQQTISDDVKGSFGFEDEEILNAIDKLTKLYETPTMRYFKAVKISMENMSVFLQTSKVNGGKDGNADTIHKIQSNVGKQMESFKKLEKIVNEEVKVAMRGKAQTGMY